MNNQSKIKGFTLIELLVAIAIIGLLSSIVIASINTARQKARDIRRLSDMHQIQIALELYHNTFGRYPTGDGAGCNNWDTSGTPEASPSFMTSLKTNGFIPTDILDPSISNSCGNYAYYRYPAGYAGCPTSSGAFYVLGVRDMESVGNPHPASPGAACPTRNWQSEFDWVMKKFEQE